MSKKILVIDDEQAIRRLFVLALADTPYQVDTAETGAMGVEMEKTNQYGVIFLDLKMPDLNGIETLRELRKINKEVPIFIITTLYGEYFDELKEAKKSGMDFEVLRKPFGSKDIQMVVRSLLDGPLLY